MSISDRRARPLTWGEAAFACLAVATLSGVVLVLAYDVHRPDRSLAQALITNPAAAWFRGIHFWSAQAFLVLAAIHTIDWLRRRGERRMGHGAWLRLALAIPAAAFLMLSGFLLRADGDARQALRVVVALLRQVAVGAPLLVGDGRLEVVYLQHAALLTLFVWLVTVEHARARWPTLRASLLAFAAAAAVSCELTPALSRGLDGTAKGPWYFLAVQEALRWTSPPVLAAAAGLALWGLLYALRWMPRRAAAWTRGALAAALLGYGVLTVVGWGCRGAGGAWDPSWRNFSSGATRAWIWRGLAVAPERLRRRPIPVVGGRPEGCLFCHAGMKGFDPSHDPASLGCASCHGGNPLTLDAAAAHRGMTRLPGNLSVASRSCGTSGCHAEVVARVRRSIMNTMSGVVEVDREAWGERAGPGPADVADLGTTGADSHLRHLCASCHLGADKTAPGPVTPESRGGGCAACHVRYGAAALADLGRPGLPRAHPALTIAVGDDACFGCHSRSGRISLSYEGWYEADPAPPAAASRRLPDGRTVYRATPDVHYEKGMRCVDCHTAAELMGDGARHERKWQQERIRCQDCHFTGKPRTFSLADADAETRVIRALRPGPAPSAPMLRAASGEALDNTFVDARAQAAAAEPTSPLPYRPLRGSIPQSTARGGARALLFRKADGAVLPLRPPAPECRGAAHRRLSCVACHSAWAPRCASCHTRFDRAAEGFDLLANRPTRGDWIETGAMIGAAPPTLGVRGDTVDPFVPGMVGTLRNGARRIALRLYARVSPHTVTRRGRSCASCHANPVALGYGEGTLRYHGGRWFFTPAHPPRGGDGLPLDAWIGFLSTRATRVSTRPEVRPLSVAEQERILAVGACLTCHPGGSAAMAAALRDFPAASRHCPRTWRQR